MLDTPTVPEATLAEQDAADPTAHAPASGNNLQPRSFSNMHMPRISCLLNKAARDLVQVCDKHIAMSHRQCLLCGYGCLKQQWHRRTALWSRGSALLSTCPVPATCLSSEKNAQCAMSTTRITRASRSEASQSVPHRQRQVKGVVAHIRLLEAVGTGC